MVSNISEFNALLERYEESPAVCNKLLRAEATQNPKNFLSQAIEAILVERPASRSLKLITELSVSAGLIEHLMNIFRQSREGAITLAKRTLVCHVRFDFALVEFLQQPRTTQVGEEAFFHTVLDILDAISKDDRLVPGVLKLLNHSNPKIRSKAAMFVGSRTQNLTWVTSRAGDDDTRVRANILESLHGLQSDFVHQVFRNNVGDQNNRVAGNAILGLYLMGDATSVPLIYELANHQDARFRNTCAWLIGRARDPRFSQVLSGLMNDPEELVRRQAFKSLGEARKALKEAANKPQLRTAILKAHDAAEPTLVATVHDGAGTFVHGIPATSFMVKTGSPLAFVRSYAVEEYNISTSLSVGFVLCLPAGEEAIAGIFAEAISSCSGLRRPKDKWAVVKVRSTAGTGSQTFEPDTRVRNDNSILKVNFFATQPRVDRPTPALEYSADQDRIEAMLRAAPLSESGNTAASTIESLCGAGLGRGRTHLIFIGASSNQDVAKDLFANRSDLPANVHILATSCAWQTAESRSLASATGGIYKKITTVEEVQQACFDTYSSLLHHYRIRWREGTGNIGLDISSEMGRGSALYELEPTSEEDRILPAGNFPLLSDNTMQPSPAECLS